MMTTEQIVASHKANVETLFGLTSKAFEGMEKLVELNLTATKAALSESAQSTKAALSVKDAQELMAHGDTERARQYLNKAKALLFREMRG
jgi:hypothetical protein